MSKQTETETAARNVAQETAILRSGFGYWDVTKYPYGGCFRRATTDEIVTIVGPSHKVGQTKIVFPDGRLAHAPNLGLISIDANDDPQTEDNLAIWGN